MRCHRRGDPLPTAQSTREDGRKFPACQRCWRTKVPCRLAAIACRLVLLRLARGFEPGLSRLPRIAAGALVRKETHKTRVPGHAFCQGFALERVGGIAAAHEFRAAETEQREDDDRRDHNRPAQARKRHQTPPRRLKRLVHSGSTADAAGGIPNQYLPTMSVGAATLF